MKKTTLKKEPAKLKLVKGKKDAKCAGINVKSMATIMKEKAKANKKPTAKIQSNPRGQFNVQWGQPKFEWFKNVAIKFGMSRTQLIIKAVEEYVTKNKPMAK